MKITVNGLQEEIHTGCRSYLYVGQLLKMLKLEQAPDMKVTVNGCLVKKCTYAVEEIKSADKVEITTEQ